MDSEIRVSKPSSPLVPEDEKMEKKELEPRDVVAAQQEQKPTTLYKGITDFLHSALSFPLSFVGGAAGALLALPLALLEAKPSVTIGQQKSSKEMTADGAVVGLLGRVAAQAATQAVLRQALKSTSLTRKDLKTEKKQLIAEIGWGNPTPEDIKTKSAEISRIDAKLLYIEQNSKARKIEAKLSARREKLVGKNRLIKTRLQNAQDKMKLVDKGSSEYAGLIERTERLKEKLFENNNKILLIDDKRSYKGVSLGQEVKVSKLSGGVNLVEKVEMAEEAVAIKKTLEIDDLQKAFQIEAIGALSESFPQANVVAARRKGAEVATGNVEGLVIGAEAIKQLKRDSEATQHTALAALSFQMWDLHTNNIGIDKAKNLVLFDTDLALFEDNDYVTLEGTFQSPLGHNELQDLNIEVTDKVLDEHVEQLEHAISSQFLGREHGFTEQEAAAIQQLLIEQFGDISGFRVYDDDQYQNDIYSNSSIDSVRKDFVGMMKQMEPEAVDFFEKLGEKISPEKVELLKKRPQLLHPEKLSIRQMEVLIERKNHLQGFIALRKEFQNLSIDKLSDSEIDVKKGLILQNIDHLPISTREKKGLLKDLDNSDQKVVREAIKKVQSLVGGDRVKWNTLARSMYPTMAAMHATAEALAKAEGIDCVFSGQLSWQRKDYGSNIEEPLIEEHGQRLEWIFSRK